MSSPFLSGPCYAGPLKQLIGEDAGRLAFNSHSSGHGQSNYSYTGGDQGQYGQYYDNSGQPDVPYGYGDENGGGYYPDDGGYGTIYGGGGYYPNTTYEATQPQPQDYDYQQQQQHQHQHQQHQQQLQLQLAYQLQLQQQQRLQQQQQQQQQFIDLGAGNTDMVTGLVRRRIIIRQLHDKATHDDVQDLLDKFAGMDKGLLRMKLVEVRLATEKLPVYTPHGPDPDGGGGGGDAGEGSSSNAAAGRNNNNNRNRDRDNNNNNNNNNNNKEKNKNGWHQPRRRGGSKGGSGDQSRPVVADGSIAGKEK
ncbi:hypothetical protein MAPG_07928 [Magnaporthiopsis poae ATCC 64411]|uniref:Uncharacterized protein n=1 Tax=Magnaporthiopsis poae (strain ATCC 64411 / 73-15) TaxID=644358 RepID=A0A0C4E5Z9_MAGP6|nr:hypothetical protein MAPG_07928 [Magnaporthiopsis poae ATCC 64411]